MSTTKYINNNVNVDTLMVGDHVYNSVIHDQEGVYIAANSSTTITVSNFFFPTTYDPHLEAGELIVLGYSVSAGSIKCTRVPFTITRNGSTRSGTLGTAFGTASTANSGADITVSKSGDNLNISLTLTNISTLVIYDARVIVYKSSMIRNLRSLNNNHKTIEGSLVIPAGSSLANSRQYYKLTGGSNTTGNFVVSSAGFSIPIVRNLFSNSSLFVSELVVITPPSTAAAKAGKVMVVAIGANRALSAPYNLVSREASGSGGSSYTFSISGNNVNAFIDLTAGPNRQFGFTEAAEIRFFDSALVSETRVVPPLALTSNSTALSQTLADAGTYTVTTSPVPFPPDAMTSDSTTLSLDGYGSGTYMISTSTTLNASTTGFRAFNKTYPSMTTADYWHSSSGVYTASTGVYAGTVSSPASGNTYNGEWLQIQCPVAFTLASFGIWPRSDGTNATLRSPRSFVVIGSNDGSTWTLVHEETNINNWVASTGRLFTVTTNPASYNYYRIVVRAVGNTASGGANQDSVQIQELVYYATTATNTTAFQAFDKLATTSWYSGSDYRTGDGVYLGLTTTTVSSVAYSGSWIQIQCPTAIKPGTLSLTPNQSPLIHTRRHPRSFVLAGSTNGSTWTLVYSTAQNVTGSAVNSFEITNSTGAEYTYFRLIVLAVGNFAATSTPAYPPATLTSNSTVISGQEYGNGTYTASASTNITGSDPFEAFSTNTREYWQSATGVYGSDGNYTGTVSSTASSVAYSGEWVQITLPTAITVQTISLQADPMYDEWLRNAPRSFVLMGSNNGGSTFTYLFDTTNETTWSAPYDVKYYYVNATASFSTYRLVVRRTGTLSSGNSNFTRVYYMSLNPVFQVSRFPPSSVSMAANSVTISGLTYGNGSYVASASTATTSQQEAYFAFDGLSTTYWQSALTYTASTGVYTGAVSTTASGTSYSGEFIQIQLPVPIFLRYYTITPRQDASLWLQTAPQSFILAGSNDGGSTWTLIDTQSSLSWTSAAARNFYASTGTTNSYNSFRIVALVVGNTGQTTLRDSFQIATFELFGAAILSNAIELGDVSVSEIAYTTDFATKEYPPLSMSTNNTPMSVAPYGRGVYVASASTQNGSSAPFLAFDKTYNTTSTNFWHGNGSYTATTGVYAGTVSSTASGSSYLGDWLQIQLAEPVRLRHFVLWPRMDSSLWSVRSPRSFVVMGSNDASTWTLVHEETNVNNWTNAARSFRVASASPSAFLLFRMVVRAVGNLSSGGSNQTSVQIQEWLLFGDATTTTTTTQETVVELEFPPAAMTAATTSITSTLYGTGTYVSDKSSSVNAEWYAFNKSASDSLFWQSASNRYAAETGNYSGAVTTSGPNGTDTGGYNGEWIQLLMPAPILLTGYYIVQQNAREWVLLGSIDSGLTWELIDTRVSASSSSAMQQKFSVPATALPCNAFRMVFQKVATSGGTTTSVSVNEIKFFGRPVLNMYPPGDITAAPHTFSGLRYGNGQYTSSHSGSSNSTSSFTGWNSTTSTWDSLVAYNGTTGAYTGTVASTTAAATTYNGEWLQIQLPEPITVESYNINSVDSSFSQWRSPRSFVLLGSNDGATWVLLDEETSVTTWAQRANSKNFVVDTRERYMYFRLVIRAIGNYPDNNNSNSTYCQITKVTLFSTPAATGGCVSLNSRMHFGGSGNTLVDSNYLANCTWTGQVNSIPVGNMTGSSTIISGLAYGDGLYTATATTSSSGSNAAWNAFDGSASTFWEPVSSNGPTTTATNGQTYTGEWLQIQMPVSVSAYGVAIRAAAANGLQSFVVLGSSDGGVTWNYAHDETNQVFNSGQQKSIIFANQTARYSYWRVVVRTTPAAIADLRILFHNGEFILNGGSGTMRHLNGVTQFSINESFSLNLWVYINGGGSNSGTRSIIEKWDTNSSTAFPYAVRYVSASSTIEFRQYDGTTSSLVSVAGVSTDTYVNVTCTYNAATRVMAVYINGVFRASTTSTVTSTSNTTPVYLGYDTFAGRYALVQIYNSCLSDVGVQALYNSYR